MKHGDLFPKQASLHAVKGFPADLSASFAEFWLAYPERVPNPRSLAATEFARAVRGGATPAQLIAAAAAYAAEVKRLGTANDFIVHARTFLRQQRWQDYLSSASGPTSAPPGMPAPVHPLWPVLKPHMDASTFTAWIGRCAVIQHTSERLILRAPSSFIAARMRTDFIPLIRRALDLGGTFQIVLQLPEAS